LVKASHEPFIEGTSFTTGCGAISLLSSDRPLPPLAGPILAHPRPVGPHDPPARTALPRWSFNPKNTAAQFAGMASIGGDRAELEH